MSHIKIRDCSGRDLDWISPLIIECARDGHFAPSVAAQSKDLISEILTRGGVTMMKLRGSIQQPRFCAGVIRVAEIGGEAAGFLVIINEGSEVELHLSATKRGFRRNGCFDALIRHEIATQASSEKIFARCYRKSSWAINALKKRGFLIAVDGEPVELVLPQRRRQ